MFTLISYLVDMSNLMIWYVGFYVVSESAINIGTNFMIQYKKNKKLNVAYSETLKETMRSIEKDLENKGTRIGNFKRLTSQFQKVGIILYKYVKNEYKIKSTVDEKGVSMLHLVSTTTEKNNMKEQIRILETKLNKIEKIEFMKNSNDIKNDEVNNEVSNKNVKFNNEDAEIKEDKEEPNNNDKKVKIV